MFVFTAIKLYQSLFFFLISDILLAVRHFQLTKYFRKGIVTSYSHDDVIKFFFFKHSITLTSHKKLFSTILVVDYFVIDYQATLVFVL